ncbi:MAG: peptidylprolyl isomerase [Halioglobus sp.]
MRVKNVVLVALVSWCMAAHSVAEDVYVLEDGGIGITQQELEFIVKNWTPQMQQAAVNDVGDRFELLNRALASKKIAAEAAKETAEENPDRYWYQQLVVRNQMREFAVNNYMADLEVPDLNELAQERYLTDKEKFAAVPETRYTAHILIMCNAKVGCNRPKAEALADKAMAELETGADFATLAKQYSEDPGSKDKGGTFDMWLKKGDPRVDPHYVKGAFEIANTGELARVNSQFGIHIIRLDEVKPKHYRSYEDSKGDIMEALAKEYQKLAAKAYDAQFRMGDDAVINGAAMEEIFDKYKTAAPQ